MTRVIRIDGGEYPVTDAWFEEVIAPSGRTSFKTDQLEIARQGLMRTSNQRELRDEERQLLEAVTDILNVASAIRFTRGRPLSDFGFEGWDQVHGNAQHRNCGCITQSIFDHYKARAHQEHEHHVHTPRRVCKEHQHLKYDMLAHWGALAGE